MPLRLGPGCRQAGAPGANANFEAQTAVLKRLLEAQTGSTAAHNLGPICGPTLPQYAERGLLLLCVFVSVKGAGVICLRESSESVSTVFLSFLLSRKHITQQFAGFYNPNHNRYNKQLLNILQAGVSAQLPSNQTVSRSSAMSHSKAKMASTLHNTIHSRSSPLRVIPHTRSNRQASNDIHTVPRHQFMMVITNKCMPFLRSEFSLVQSSVQYAESSFLPNQAS